MAERNIHRVTLRDVAKACGLSAPTVSQILNNRSVNFSSEETRRLVRETARQMGYQPNIGYKLMRGMTTKTVALILGFAIQREEEYVKELVFLLLNRLSSRGYAAGMGQTRQSDGSDASARSRTLHLHRKTL